jgi:hypothetical protein
MKRFAILATFALVMGIGGAMAGPSDTGNCARPDAVTTPTARAQFAANFQNRFLRPPGNIHQVACTRQQAEVCRTLRNSCDDPCRPAAGGGGEIERMCHRSCCFSWVQCLELCGDNVQTSCEQP